MTTLQKVIKYLAIGFAVFLIAVVINTIIGGVELLTEGFSFINNKTQNVEIDEDYSTYRKFDESINYLNIDLAGSNLIIKTGEDLSVDTNSKNIKITNDNNRLMIVETKKKINRGFKDVIVTIPSNLIFDRVNISTGAGKVSVNGINTDILKMELGAGKVTLESIYSDKTKIETGAGNVDIKNSSLNDLDLELGVGEINIDGNITGESSIESGIGSLNLKLNLPSYMYKFDLEKGLGEIQVNNEKITGNKVIGDGDNYIKIEGGIGSIKINTDK